jgi:predicted dehydrogenase
VPVIAAAIKAGKHIYCDKPLACNADEARQVLGLLAGYTGTSQMALQYRFLPATLRAKQLVRDGFLGTVLNFRCAYLHSGYVDPKRPFSWRLDKSQSGGGALYDLGAHILDLTEHLAGPITDVYCTCETFTRGRPRPDGTGMAEVQVDDHAVVLGHTHEGALGVVEASRVATGTNDDLRFEIHGTQGALRFNLMNPNWLEAYDNREAGEPIGGNKGWTQIECVQRYPAPAGFPGPKFSVGWIRAHMAAIYNFVTAVAEGRPAAPDLARGAHLQLLLDCCYASAGTGQWQSVDHHSQNQADTLATQSP